MNPLHGILSQRSYCFRCKDIIFHDLELDRNLYGDIEIGFYRVVSSINLFCEFCGSGILNNEFIGRECPLCLDIMCVCDGDQFRFYRINLSDVMLRTQEVFEMEQLIWEELSFVYRHQMVRIKTLDN